MATKYVNVIGDRIVLLVDILITAKDIKVHIKEVQSSDFRSLANAKAWDTNNGANLSLKLMSSKPTVKGLANALFEVNHILKSIKIKADDDLMPLSIDQAYIGATSINAKGEARANLQLTLNDGAIKETTVDANGNSLIVLDTP